ncbi:MAG: SapC family protein [Caulobacterales bacterium]|nr:SapC family protein [Caulobacterales bacterium]
MSDASGQGSVELVGNLPFYKRPEPLSADRHGQLGVKRNVNFSFVREAHVVPITVGEFGPAALVYPVIFAGDSKAPLAVMGLRAGENLFVDEAGAVDSEIYMPAFVRRYPFVFAEDRANDRFVVCVDTESDLVAPDGERRLFENGQPTQFTNDSVEFLKSFEQQRQATQQLVKVFQDNDLFENKDVTFQPQYADGSPAEPVKVADYFAVSLEKVGQLPADKLVELRDSGALAAIYVHNLSLLNWQRVLSRALRKSQGASAAAS